VNDPKPASPLVGFLDALKNLPLVEQDWPTEGKQPYMEWRTEHDPEGAQRLGAEIEFVRQFAVLPIVAVAGLINSGKSSLVAAFLSPAERERVLRGEKARGGTQRFTLWLPAAWEKDADFRNRLDGELVGFFGHAPEPLEIDPARAKDQQRAVDSLRVPLLAFDAALDRLGVALFDCPDIQRPQPGGEAGVNARLEVLGAAGKICAGVILVATRKEIEVRELQNIADCLPSATRVYAINFLRRETPHEFLRDAPADVGNNWCYVAYDFEVSANRSIAPAIDPNFCTGADPDPERRLPFFFEALPEAERNTPTAVGAARALTEIGARFSPEALRQRRQVELTATLRKTFNAELGGLKQRVADDSRGLEDAHNDLFETLLRLMLDGKRLRIKIDSEIAASMAESIRRTAPWDLRIALLLKKGILDAISAAAGGVQKALRVLQALGGKISFAARKGEIERSQLDPRRVQEELRNWSARHGAVKDMAFWAEDAGAIVERFRAEERTNLIPDEWDAITGAFWDTAPRGRARLAILATVLTTLGAAAWIVIEPFGGAVMFAAAVKGHVVALTVGELFSVLGVGAAGAAGFAALLEKNLEAKLGHQQFSNLFAIACDRIGLPRGVPRAREAEFPPPDVVEQRKREAFGIRERGWRRARIDQANLEQLLPLLDRV
jgi:hypothetical protein